jgi:hypothetical protein
LAATSPFENAGTTSLGREKFIPTQPLQPNMSSCGSSSA